MSESENNLDNFFKRRAQQANVEFNEDDWLRMEARLNAEMPHRPVFWLWLRKYWYAPILLGFLATGWWWLPVTPTLNTEFNTISEQAPSDRQSPPQSGTETESDQPTTALREQSLDNSSAGVKILSDRKEQQVVQKVNEDYIQSGKEKTSSGQLLKDLQNSGDAGREKNIQETNDIGYVVLENGNGAPRLSGTSFPHFLSPVVAFPLLTPDIPESLEQLQIDPSIKKHDRSYFFVGVGYSPDFSTVGLDNFIAPGSRWKADLGYAFSPRFQLLSGVVMVNNKYEADGDEYHAPDGYWNYGEGANEAYGECTMIDIPLNLRYNFITVGRHNAFVSSGLSTYFLTEEDYYFEYDQDYPDSPDHWGTDNTSVYPFSIINVSAGYEYMMKNRGSFLMEPFIKIPTAGVGWGDVDLYTIGIYFAYQYRFRP